MTLCVPALPAINQDFAASNAEVQFAISIFLFGLAVAQPVHGILVDHCGRRPVLLYGFGLFALASLACALANNIVCLVLFRFLQAAGIATATVVARAMIRNTSSAGDSACYIAYLAVGMGLAPMVAPMLSGYLIEVSGWRSSFFLTGLLAVVVLVWILATLPETRKHTDSVESGLKQMRNNIKVLCYSKSFWGYTLIILSTHLMTLTLMDLLHHFCCCSLFRVWSTRQLWLGR